MEPPESMRLDKWLKIVRLFKQRAKAVEAVEAGHVKVNGERAKPAKSIRVGDEVTVKLGNRYCELTVKGLSEKSISAKLARELYEMHVPEGLTDELSEWLNIVAAEDRRRRREWNHDMGKKDRREVQKRKYGGDD